MKLIQGNVALKLPISPLAGEMPGKAEGVLSLRPVVSTNRNNSIRPV
ncbi:hypothetical protein [Mesorhizobium sp.]|nr:hypothetical protein [Mesorhizobium sp.]